MAEEVLLFKKDGTPKSMHWKCTEKYKLPSKVKVDTISFKQAFENPINEVIKVLDNCNKGCPNLHHCKIIEQEGSEETIEVFKLGHPLPCYNDTECSSKLRILRCATFPLPSAVNRFERCVQCTKCSLVGEG